MSFFGELKKYLDADTLCRMYYCGDHEVFEFYKECDKDSLVSRREFPFLESLLLFLEMDHRCGPIPSPASGSADNQILYASDSGILRIR